MARSSRAALISASPARRPTATPRKSRQRKTKRPSEPASSTLSTPPLPGKGGCRKEPSRFLAPARPNAGAGTSIPTTAHSSGYYDVGKGPAASLDRLLPPQALQAVHG